MPAADLKSYRNQDRHVLHTSRHDVTLPTRALFMQPTLNVTILVQKEAEGKVDTEMAIVLTSIATACKQIASLVARSSIADMTGLAGAANVQVRICICSLTCVSAVGAYCCVHRGTCSQSTAQASGTAVPAK